MTKLQTTALVVVASLVVASGTAWSQTPRPPTRPLGVKPTQPSVAGPVVSSKRQLWDIAMQLPLEQLLASRRNPPVFFIGDGIFSFYAGDTPVLGDDLAGPRQHPFLIPLARAVQLEDLRRFISRQSSGDYLLWVPYFDEAQAIIELKSLPLLAQRNRTSDELQQALFAADGEVVAKLLEGATKFAAVHRLTYRRANTLQMVAHRTQVSLNVTPPGATVKFIPSTFYTSDDRFPYMWFEIQPNDRLGGTYYYKASWPNGERSGPNQIRVEVQGQTISITPEK